VSGVRTLTGMDAPFVLLERISVGLLAALSGAPEAQGPLWSLLYLPCRSHTAWLPRSCRKNCMNEASTPYETSGRALGVGTAVTRVCRKHTSNGSAARARAALPMTGFSGVARPLAA
jgi:hypothetical protein